MKKTRISKGKQEWVLLTLLMMRANPEWGTEEAYTPSLCPNTSQNLRAGNNHTFCPIPLDLCVIISLIKSAVSCKWLLVAFDRQVSWNGHETRYVVISKHNLLSLVDPAGDFLKGKWLSPIGHQSFHQLSWIFLWQVPQRPDYIRRGFNTNFLAEATK